jgi:hypothetical protein
VTRSTFGLAVLLAIGLAGAGCATSRAQIPEQHPTLIVPPVPPRAIEPPPATEPPAAPVPAEPPPAAPPNTRPKQRAQAEAKPPELKPDPPIEPVAAPPSPPAVAPLRTPTSPTGPEAARQIREILDNTQRTLDKVDVQGLSDDRKAHYLSAKAFIQQAEEALKKEELTQARGFAERAQNFARLLLTGR